MDGYDPGSAMGGYYYDNPQVAAPPFDTSPAAGQSGYPAPLNGVELQASDTCPKNYIIVDQTDNRSRIMFHPALAQKFGYQNFDIGRAFEPDYGRNHGRQSDNLDRASSSLKEDSDDIDALLSLEDEDEEDDVVSTGRTPGSYGGNSPDSVSSADRIPFECSMSGAAGGPKKKERMKKMVKKLRGIIPGGEQMDTPAVLDEAVRYLKSLKVEVKKLQNFKN
ncbi:unnamed protein product [Spirodela intermedia]|uniref:BHLH domain-containing protein n=1 Tax=Spirodela intermedia TaxID=51605 RepID=A0A7I8LF22_SPIIN|nr:unnamed protein product [Spirodela intermedia]